MDSLDSVEAKRKRDDEEETRPDESARAEASDEGEFEIPKEHLRLAKKRQKQSKPEAIIQKSQNRTTISDVRNVLLWVLSESQGFMPKWCMIRNKNLVESITVVITPFIDRHTLFDHAGNCAGIHPELPFFSHCIRGSMIPMSGVALHRYPTVCPVLSTFLNSPIQGKTPQWVEKLSDNEDDEKPIETEQQTRTPISEFVMTEDNRRLNDIPESLGGLAPPGFVTTMGKKSRIMFETNDVAELPPMLPNQRDAAAIAGDADLANLIGIDCEMVDTIIGKELARVSLIDHMGRVLYDSVVRPVNEVTDYLTQYSGITAKMIRECKTSFREAQERILSFLDENAILVGHAIQNDLQCLKLIHDRIIDTSDIYPHPNGHPSKHSLVFLLSRVLRESLNREGGHDSVDDAKATLRIAMKKFARGWEYNPAGSSTSRWAPLGTLFDGPRALYLDPETLDEPARYKVDGFYINPENLTEAKLKIHVVRDFQAACENNTPRRDALVAMDAKIREIISGMGDNHLVLVFSGCGDVHTFKKFEKLAGICEDETQRVDLEKALQRSKDRAVSAFAMISAVGDLPLSVRSCNKQ